MRFCNSGRGIYRLNWAKGRFNMRDQHCVLCNSIIVECMLTYKVRFISLNTFKAHKIWLYSKSYVFEHKNPTIP